MRKRNHNAEIFHRQSKINTNLFHLQNNCKPSYLYYPVVVKDKEKIQKTLFDNKIETTNLGFNEIYRDYDKFIRINCSNLEKIINGYFLLPLGHSVNITKKICGIFMQGK